MKEVEIRKTGGDSRIKGLRTQEKEKLKEDIRKHGIDVRKTCEEFYRMAGEEVYNHDWTKKEYIEEFREALGREKFKESKWWKIHIREEKHHCMEYKGKEKILLSDFIENAVDGVCAGRARMGEYKFNYNNYKEEEIKEKLYEAYKNTCEYINSKVVVKE